MFDTNDRKIREVIKELHFSILKKYKTVVSLNEKIKTDSQVIEMLLENFDASPSNCAYRMNKKYNTDLDNQDVVSIFRFLRIANPIERKEILEWANEVTLYFENALKGNTEELEKFNKKRKEGALKSGEYHKAQGRIVILMICKKLPELISAEDREKLNYLSNTLAKFVLYDLADAINKVYQIGKNKRIEKKKVLYEEYENVLNERNSLEEKLNRTEEMLLELQEDFEEQLQESKIIEMTSFFAKLNSEKYGCILDELLSSKKGMDTLKKKGFKLPLDINGIFIMTKNLAKFTQDSHIAPIMKPNDVKIVKVSDIEFCQYEGTPFKDENEEKQIIVISPGWIYRDKEIQISRPKVKEVEQND